MPNREPRAGEPVPPFVGDLQLWADILRMVGEWQAGKFGATAPLNETICTPIARNETGEDLDAFSIRQLQNLMQIPGGADPGVAHMLRTAPSWDLQPPVWHTQIDQPVVLYKSLLDEGSVPFRSSQFIYTNNVQVVNGADGYVMWNPENPAQFKTADAGVYRIMGHLGDGTVILDTHDSQPLWRYEIFSYVWQNRFFEDPLKPAVTDIRLRRLDGIEFTDADGVGVSAKLSDYLGKVAGQGIKGEGYCVHIRNEFVPITVPVRPWLKFKTTGKMSQRQVAVTIDLVEGDRQNPSTQEIFKTDDTNVEVNDPNNLFGHVESDATGIAYWREKTAADDDDGDRWEVQTCSQPIDRIAVKIKECLLYSDATKDGYFGSNGDGGQTPVVEWCLSGYSNADLPPEVVENGPDDYTLTFTNPDKYTAIEDSLVYISRVTDVDQSDPGNKTLPKSGSATSAFWKVDGVEKPIARWVKAQYSSGVWTGSTYYEGYAPFECPPDIVCSECDCLDNGDIGYGFYHPEADQYEIVSTQSGLMGNPDNATIVQSLSIDGNCNLIPTTFTAKVLCKGVPTPGSPIAFPTIQLDYVSDVILTCDGLGIHTGSVQVVGCSTPDITPDSSLYDLCQHICDCCDWIEYVAPETCDPPPQPCNCNDCYINDIIDLTITDGEPLTWFKDGEATTSQDPCVWTVPMISENEDLAQATVTYQGGGQWNVTLNAGTPPTGFTIDGDCSGGTFSSPPASVDLQVDAMPCAECECCQDCLDQVPKETLCLRPGSLTAFGHGVDLQVTDTGKDAVSLGPCMWEWEFSWYYSPDVDEQASGVSTGTVTRTNGTYVFNFGDVPQEVDDLFKLWNSGRSPDTCMTIMMNCTENDIADTNCSNPGGDCCEFDNSEFSVEAVHSPPQDCVDTSPAAALLDANGHPIAKAVARRTKTQAPALPDTRGGEFVRNNPQWFGGCSSCKSGVIALIDRWKGDPTDKQRAAVVKLIQHKNKGATEAEILEAISKI